MRAPPSPEEKAELWPRVVAAYQGYGSYQHRTIVTSRWSSATALNARLALVCTGHQVTVTGGRFARSP